MASVRRVLLSLGLGLFVQRGAQLIALLVLARTLGEAATGVHAQGAAVAALLAMAAAAGMRNPVARALAREPDAARAWLRAAVRLRLERALVLAAATIAVAWAASASPWFWTLWALQSLPAAWDLKYLADAALRTRREVAIENVASASAAVATCAWLALGGTDLTVLAGLHLGCRLLYAGAALHTIAALPGAGAGPDLAALRREARALSWSQMFGCLCVEGDVWLIARLGGDAVAGLYAVAQRLASAAGMPTVQLTRLLFAHQLHAAQRGDARRTIRVSLRATALVLLPMLAGGAVVAGDLCGLFGAPFRAAAPALAWMLAAVTLQHLGWQGLMALLARGDDRGYTRALWVQSGVQLLGMLALVPAFGAVGAAFAAALSHGAGAGVALWPCRAAVRPLDWLRGPTLVAGGTGLAVSLCGAGIAAFAGPWSRSALLPAQLVAGALAALLGIWTVELRRRWRRIGAGLSEASGLR
ncbi:MAG: lipopolysaccharide biosynthesis protein [Planctomycetota bacterium]